MRRETQRRSWWRLPAAALRIAGIAYVGGALLLSLLQARLVYHPRRDIEATPDTVGLPYEDVRFQTDDGLTLAGWFLPASGAKATILFCHGNAGNISHRLDSAVLFHQLGYSLLLFDYRGYGQSEGKPTEEGTYRDAEAAWKHLVETRGIPPSEIVISGRSLGGAVAAHLARSRTPRALVVESSFTAIPDVAAEMLWFLPVRWLIRFDYRTVDYVRQVDCPILVVHSADDRLIPFHHGREIFAAAGEPKEFLQIVGPHNGGFLQSGDRYRNGLTTFLANHQPIAPPAATTQPSTRPIR